MDAEAYKSFRSAVESPTLRAVWAKAYADRLWADGEPPWTMATIDDVKFVSQRLSAARRIVDLGCGSGALARHLVRETGAHVLGLDMNPMAVRLAQEHSAGPQYSASAQYREGDIASTGLSDAAFDGAASLDVLLFAPDKTAALTEIHRILRPGASFAGTTWELRADSAHFGIKAYDDYPNGFSNAGFEVEAYEETPDWRRLLESALAGILANSAELSAEIHPQALARLKTWATNRPPELGDSRRVRFCVRKPTAGG